MTLDELDAICWSLFGGPLSRRFTVGKIAKVCGCRDGTVRGWKNRGNVPDGYAELLRLKTKMKDLM